MALPILAAPVSPLAHDWSKPLLLLTLALACAAPERDDRSAWLRHTLVLDNQDDLERAPELVAGKFARMAASPHGFLRGTAAQFARDLLEPGGAALGPWRYTDVALADVALVGDAHVENVGSYRTASGIVTLDFNDFDAATYGPFELDLRRLGLSWWVACVQTRDALLDHAAAPSPDDCNGWVAAAAQGYRDEIAALGRDAGDATVVDDRVAAGRIADDLLAHARRDGESDDALAELTEVGDDGARRFVLGEIDPTIEITLGPRQQRVHDHTHAAVSPASFEQVARMLASWPRTLVDAGRRDRASAPLRDVVVRLGAGISSHALPRWYALLADDTLLELKQVRDAPPLPGARRPIDAPFDGNGARVVAMARELQGFVDDDGQLGYVGDTGEAFRVRALEGWQRGFDVDDLAPALAAGEWHDDDVRRFAALVGAVLARSHARARRLQGGTAREALAAVVDDGLVDDVVAFAGDYGPVVLDDHRRLRELIAADGFDLGYGRW